jgi:hypothetical protein
LTLLLFPMARIARQRFFLAGLIQARQNLRLSFQTREFRHMPATEMIVSIAVVTAPALMILHPA